ncbi:MAG TPA: hydrogenase maturation protease [Pyrinomonadaceae bacterium]
MTGARILIAGIGNIFLGDDAFGSEVARKMMQRELPEGVKVADFGIRGFDLTYALLDEYELVVLIDATPRGDAPGTLYVIEPELTELNELEPQETMVETHGMNPLRVLRMVQSMGGKFHRILIVGCEPKALDPESEGEMGLSEAVKAAVDSAVEMIESIVAETLAESKKVAAGIVRT